MNESQDNVQIWLENTTPHRVGMSVGDHAVLMTPLGALAIAQTLIQGIQTQGIKRNELSNFEPRIARAMKGMDFAMALQVLEIHAIGISLAADRISDLSDLTCHQALEWLITSALEKQASMPLAELEQITMRVKAVLQPEPPEEPQ